MSRARPITYDNQQFWFDTARNGNLASEDQLELLAAAENIEIDELLEEGLSQGEVITRLRDCLGQGSIPANVLERQRSRREQAKKSPECVMCSINGIACEGRITRHHFVNKWIMRELENYQAYAARDKCTFPVCMGRHRNLHLRTDGSNKSIVRYLTEDQKRFTHKMLTEFKEQKPKTFELIAGGDSENVYEARLIHDYLQGLFAKDHEHRPELIATVEALTS